MSFHAKGLEGGDPKASDNPENRIAHVPSESYRAPTEDDDLTCPRCGCFTQRLPEGQDIPTLSQSYESCWLLHDGSQPGEPTHSNGRLCGRERFLQAGLLEQLLTALGEEGDLTPELLEHDANTTLAFLRFAQQHPLVSPELARLLVERLCRVHASAHQDPPKKGKPVATLELVFRGSGGARAITTRHQGELQALLADLLDEDLGLFGAFKGSDLWNCERVYQVKRVLIDEWRTPQGGFELAWPPAAHPDQGGQG